MSNIDFSQAITAEDKAEAAALARAVELKAECGSRIYAIISETAQFNAGNATTAFATKISRGKTREDALSETGLSEADLDVIEAGRVWIEDMQIECRRAIADQNDPVWPDVPNGVAELAARF